MNVVGVKRNLTWTQNFSRKSERKYHLEGQSFRRQYKHETWVRRNWMALDEFLSCDYTHEVSGSIQGHAFLKTRQTKGPFECVSSRKC